MVDESIIIPVEVPMKYHSPFSTIIISIAVLLVFLAVALLTVAALSMTSPTLILANELMEKLESSDSDISISFGSIDRNLRDLMIFYVEICIIKMKMSWISLREKCVLEERFIIFSFEKS